MRLAFLLILALLHNLSWVWFVEILNCMCLTGGFTLNRQTWIHFSHLMDGGFSCSYSLPLWLSFFFVNWGIWGHKKLEGSHRGWRVKLHGDDHITLQEPAPVPVSWLLLCQMGYQWPVCTFMEEWSETGFSITKPQHLLCGKSTSKKKWLKYPLKCGLLTQGLWQDLGASPCPRLVTELPLDFFATWGCLMCWVSFQRWLVPRFAAEMTASPCLSF